MCVLFSKLDLLEQSPSHEAACLEVISNLSLGEGFTEVDLQMITKLPDKCSPSAQFHSILLEEILKLKDDPVLSLLQQPETESKKSFNFLFRAAQYHDNAKVCIYYDNIQLNTNATKTYHYDVIICFKLLETLLREHSITHITTL